METLYSKFSIRNLKLLIVFLLIPSFSLLAQINGTYSVGGTGSDYASIELAVSDLTTQGVSGPVVFQIAVGIYEEQVIIGEITGVSTTNTITFESASGNAADVDIQFASTTSAENYVWRFNNASNIILRNLSFTATGTTYSRVLHMIQGGHDILVENCILTSPSTTSTSGDRGVVLFSPARSSDVRFINNTVSGGAYGYHYRASSDNSKALGAVVTGNTITGVRYRGLNLIDLNDVEISNNIISTGNADYNYWGLGLEDCDGALNITLNKIETNSGYGVFMRYCGASTTTPGLIANNFISAGGSRGSFYFGGNSHHRIYHNSVNQRSSSEAFYFEGSGQVGNELHNNIFKANTGPSIRIYYAGAITSSDYNDFYTSGTYIGAWGNTYIGDLSTWQSTSSMEANSLSFDPQFVSDTDLHATAPGLSTAGVAVTEVTTDIDGEPRQDPPSIGADEYSSAAFAPLAGTYTIDPNGSGERNFTTISSAVDAMVINGISAAVIFELANGTYNEQVLMPDISGGSDTNTITFESASGNAADVDIQFASTTSAENYVWRFNNASNIILRNLSFTATGTTYSRALHMIQRGDDILVENCILTSPSTTNTSGDRGVVIFGPARSSDVRFINNTIKGGAYGLYYRASSDNSKALGAVVTGNIITGASFRGINLMDLNDVEISNNSIATDNANYNYWGLGLEDCDGALNISLNKIETNSGYGIYMRYCGASATAPGLIANNFISVAGSRSGLHFSENSNYGIYYNSVNHRGNSEAFYFNGYNQSGNELRNNIFKANSGLSMLVYSAEAITSSDYNNLYTSGTYIGRWGSTNIGGFEEWQSTSGMEANSLNFDPQFVSDTDLHATAPGLSTAGVAVTEVTTDIDGEPRQDPPSIGADEYSSAAFAPLAGTYTIDPNSSGERNFTTISSAVDAMVINGISAAVIFELANGTYNEQVLMPDISGGSDTNTITFESASGNAADVDIQFASTTSAENYVWRFNNASNIILRNLSFTATGTTYSRALHMIQRGDDILVENCILTSPSTTNTSGDRGVVIFGPARSSDVRFINNTIKGGAYGLYYRASSDNSKALGAVVTGNIITGASFRGINLMDLNDVEISNNSIATDNANYNYWGLGLEDCDGALNISLNKIETNSGYGIYMRYCGASATAPGLIANNFISVAGSRSGLHFSENSNYGIYYNSVNHRGNSEAFYFNGYNQSGNELRNNIFKANSGLSMLVYSAEAITSSDYNNLYTSGTYIGRWGSTNIGGFEEWQSTSGMEANSLNFDPQFVSDTDLHATAPGLSTAGVAVTEVTTDIDGEPRQDPPSIGADEYSSAAFAPLAGTYTIDPNSSGERNFTTISSAVDAMVINGISAAVIFELANGTYNEQVLMPDISGGSDTNTITFESASGNAADVDIQFASTTSAENYVWRFNNASNIILRNLSFTATGTTYSRALHMIQRGDDILVENCILTSPSTTNTSGDRGVVIFGPARSSDVRFINNTIKGGAYGLYYRASSDNSKALGAVVTGNIITGASFRGINLMDLNDVEISNNSIATDNANYNYWGLGLEDCDGALNISLNKIETNSGYGIYMRYCGASATAPGLIANNFISVAGSRSGLHFSENSNYGIYYNSVNHRGNSEAFYFNGYNQSGNELRNNIFKANSGLSMLVYSAEAITSSDYNNLYTSGTYIGRWGSTNIGGFEEWQSTSGMEANSLNFDPQFVSGTDLHAQAEQLQDAGAPLTEVTTDIDGETRDDTPSIGADEYSLIQRYTISYTFNGQGTVGQLPDAESYEEGVSVQLSAIPADGWVFVSWGGDIDPALIDQNPIDITMDQDKAITVNFVEELILSATTIPATCSNLENGSIDLTVSGGSGTYAYDWDNDLVGLYDTTPDTEDLSNLLPGTYTVIVTDENELTRTLEVVVSSDATATIWYEDADGDKYGNPDVTRLECIQPAGFVANNTDCDDEVFEINPGAIEVCNGIDDNCDGRIDDGLDIITYYLDSDNDGYGTDNANTNISSCEVPEEPLYVTLAGDCNDSDPGINSGAAEACDGIDNNCDGVIDEGFEAITSITCVSDQTIQLLEGECVYAHSGLEWDISANDICSTNLVNTSFNSDSENWTYRSPADPSSSISWIENGGNAGGFIRFNEPGQGAGDYFQAPTLFLGNKEGYYGGSLNFDLKISSTSNASVVDHILLSGKGITLAHSITAPTEDWNNYSVLLEEGEWRNLTTGNPATEVEIRNVLGNVEELNIWADWILGSEQTDLDNFHMIPGPAFYELSGNTIGIGNSLDNTTFNTGQTLVTWKVPLSNGSIVQCQFSVTVEDNILPAITVGEDLVSSTSLDGTGDCSVEIEIPDVEISDNCSVQSLSWEMTGATILLGSGQVGLKSFNSGETIIEYTLTDVNTNSSTVILKVTVLDDEDPTITAPLAVTANTSDDGLDNCSTTVQLGTPTTSDNCAGETYKAFVDGTEIPTATYAFTKGETTVTWTVTDAAGNTASADQLVIVLDDENPTITAPVAVTANTSDDGVDNCSTTVQLGTPTTSDNCAGETYKAFIDGTEIPTATYAFAKGETTVTWTVTDAAGNTASADQLVTVVDDEDPTITAPLAVTANTSDDGIDNCTTTVVLGTPTTSDNCTGETYKAFIGERQIVPATELFEKGETTVTWIVTDAVGNTASADQLVTVVDDEDPTITAPLAVTANTSDDGVDNCSTTVQLGTPTTSDNCVGETYKAFVDGTEIPTATYAFAKGETTVTWTVTDAAGNTASADQLVTVVDDEIPTITAPVAVTANTSDDGVDNCSTTVQLGVPTTEDNCAGETYKAFVDGTEITTATYAFAKGETTVTWIVTDAAGNTASADQLVTVFDDEDPTITAPVAVTANTSDDGVDNCSTTVQLGTPTTSDNCAGETYKAFIDGTEIPTATYAFAKGETTVTWTVTDVVGNTASADQLVTVVDDEIPTITAPVAVTAKTSDDGVDNCSTTVQLGTPTTSDNCAGETYKAFVDGTEIPTATYAFAKGETTVTWTVTDAAGNTASADQLVTVVDDENPTIIAPVAVTANTSDDGIDNCITTVVLGTPTTSDNCTGETYEAFIGERQIDPATEPFEKGETTVTWIVTDAAGNTASADQLVTVVDDENPTIIAPVAVTANTSDDGVDNCSTTVQLGTPTTGDNCSGETYEAFIGERQIVPATEPFEKGETTVTWIVTDAVSNTASADQLVTVVDDEDPSVNTIQAQTQYSENCAGVLEDYRSLVETDDNCSESLIITQQPAPGTTISGITEISLIVEDGSDNSNSVAFNVIVKSGVTLYLDADGDGYGIDDSATNIDSCNNPGSGYSLVAGDCNDVDNTIYPDENGNCSEDVCSKDSIPLLLDFTAPQDPVKIGTSINISLTYTDENLTDVTWIWGDDSSTQGSVSSNEVFGSHAYSTPGVYTINCIVEDECGNYNSKDYQYVVAYDPSGGFVTGSGWFYSEPGAYRLDETAEGDARFGFVSKYKKGATVPEGRTQFEFISEDFSFISNEYEWLIVAGEKAMFKGVGEINGQSGYRFMISAIDDNDVGDRFRIKIWEEINSTEYVIYDNQYGDAEDANANTYLTKGGIKIHSGKGKSYSDINGDSELTVSYSLSVYPNPLDSEAIWLQFSAREIDEIFEIGIYDLFGRRLDSTTIEVSKNGGEYFWPVDHSSWEQGFYVLRAKSGTQEFKIKLMK